MITPIEVLYSVPTILCVNKYAILWKFRFICCYILTNKRYYWSRTSYTTAIPVTKIVLFIYKVKWESSNGMTIWYVYLIINLVFRKKPALQAKMTILSQWSCSHFKLFSSTNKQDHPVNKHKLKGVHKVVK